MTTATPETDAYRTALRATLVSIGVLAVAGAVAGWWIAQGPGLTAALVGVSIAALAGLTTQAAMLYGHRMGISALATVVLGSWLVKMVLIIVALVVLQGIEDFHRALFAAFAMMGVVATLVIDVWVILRARVPYVDAGSNRAKE